MAALVAMNESLVTRVVNDLEAQCRIPSFRPRRAAPTRGAEAQEATEERSGPQRPKTGSGQKAGASASQFRRHRLIKGLPRLGNRVDPECESSRSEQVGDGTIEAWRLHFSKSVNGASRLGPGMGQAAGGKNLRRPLFQRRPLGRRSVAPIGLRALPRRPGLLGAEVLVRVVHQGIEPALGSCLGEAFSGDPLFQGFPNRKIVLLFSALALQESGAPRQQSGSYDFWKLICGFSDDANPQNDHVPFREGRCALCQLLPGHQEGLLHGTLFAVAPYAEDGVCGVSFCHPGPNSGGGRLDCWSELFHCTNSGASTEQRIRPAAITGPTFRAPFGRAIEERVRHGYSCRRKGTSHRVREDVRSGYDHSRAAVA